MKIALIGQKGIPAKFGGVERHVEELAAKMAENGHEVFVYVRNNYTDKNIKEYRGVKLIHLPSISTKNLDAITHTFFAAVHALFMRYDVVHFHAIGPNSLAWIVKTFTRRTAVISTFHCQDYNHKKWGSFAQMYLKFGEMVTCKVADRTIAVSRELKRYAKDVYNRNTTFIPNGADVTINKETNQLDAWNLEAGKYILSVSRLVAHKNIHHLIEAFQKIEEEGRNEKQFKLVIVGDGFYTDDYVEKIKKLANGSENIIFTGNQTGEALEQLFSNAYLFVQPSEAEGLSIALLESMSYGVAPLVSDIRENMDVVDGLGFSFSVNNVRSLKEKLIYLMANEDIVKHRGNLSKTEADLHYNWDVIAQDTLNLYEETLEQKALKSKKLIKEKA